MYTIENYKECKRFNSMYAEIRDFLQTNADGNYNEHFHWGRFDWMMAHPELDVEMLSKIALFRNKSGRISGVVMFDTDMDNRWYILHSTSDESLLEQMIDYIVKIDGEATSIKVNLNDSVLCMMLKNIGFERRFKESVLEMKLPFELTCHLPDGYSFNASDSIINDEQWRLVIHRGFENYGFPQELSGEAAEAEKHLENAEYIKVFAIKDREYISHCGIWYEGGDTAYIEPVVTIPEHRYKGLAKAVVYEAMNRAKVRGAKRAIVLSDKEFYLRIGMVKSSEFATWIKR